MSDTVYPSAVAAVAKMLVDSGFADVHTVAPSALDCEEPIVVRPGEFNRDATMTDAEHGTLCVQVLVVRVYMWDGTGDASDCENALRAIDWTPYARISRKRVCGIDTDEPDLLKVDDSYRFVYGFNVYLTVERAL